MRHGSVWPKDNPESGEAGRNAMSFCEHCEGQRFDRAQVLRVLRATRKRLKASDTDYSADESLALAIEAVRGVAIPHLELVDDVVEGQVIH